MNIVITGATRGLGLAAARALLARGHTVVICSEDGDDVARALDTLQRDGLPARGMRCDICSEQQVIDLLGFAQADGQPVDAWINNAGMPGITGRTDQIPTAYLQRLIDTNIKGTCLCSVHALRLFHAQGHGRLLNVLGRGATRPVPFSNSYGPAKTWIRSFTRAIATEVRGTNIAVATFQPGLVHTQMTLDVQVVAGHEHRMKLLPAAQRYLGNEPEFAGEHLARIITGNMRNGKAYRLPVLGPALRRLIAGAPAIPITTRTIDAETDPR
ncbi:MAG: SDR family oxidoreductase [Chromatiales bacterium]|nr:MAG: SDR family oxidoreductase [Chromatiales bacterium]